MSEWPMVKLGNVIKVVDTTEYIEHPTEETFITLKMHGNGAVKRNIGDGKTPKPFRGFRAKAGQFIYSRIDARNGAFGLIPAELNNAVVSKDFPLYNINEAKIIPSLLVQICTSDQFINQIKSLSNGATNRQRIKEEILENLTIPLPPLDKQKRIAEILGSIQNAIELTSLQLDDISSSMKIESWTLTRDSPQTQLSHYIKKITSGKSLKEGNWENFQNCILKISAVTTGFFDDSEIKPLPESYTPQAPHKVNTGDILLSRANTTELVGASAIVENAANNLYLPDKLWKLHIKDDVDTYFFWHLLQTKPVRSSISKASSGSGGSMKNISQKSFLNITVPKISREVQNQIGKNIRLQHILRSLLIKKLNLLQELQRSLSVRAFAGEL